MELLKKKDKELEKAESNVEKTHQAKYYRPTTDIYETDNEIIVQLEMPGVNKEAISVNFEDGALKIEGKIDPKKYEGLSPLYTEYNVGHYTRSFSVSKDLEVENIKAVSEDGVLTVTVPKSPARKPRKIAVT